jgi:hypothetical protein
MWTLVWDKADRVDVALIDWPFVTVPSRRVRRYDQPLAQRSHHGRLPLGARRAWSDKLRTCCNRRAAAALRLSPVRTGVGMRVGTIAHES